MRKGAAIQRLSPTYTTGLVEDSKVDKWLSRSSHIAQTALLAATFLGFYYTVIPLYEKALLEERVAKLEIDVSAREKVLAEVNADLAIKRAELADIKVSLTTTQKELRRYALHSLVNYVGPDCLGFMGPEPMDVILDKSFVQCVKAKARQTNFVSNEDMRRFIAALDAAESGLRKRAAEVKAKISAIDKEQERSGVRLGILNYLCNIPSLTLTAL